MGSTPCLGPDDGAPVRFGPGLACADRVFRFGKSRVRRQEKWSHHKISG